MRSNALIDNRRGTFSNGGGILATRHHLLDTRVGALTFVYQTLLGTLLWLVQHLPFGPKSEVLSTVSGVEGGGVKVDMDLTSVALLLMVICERQPSQFTSK